MDLQLRGKKALVLGSSQGIGRAIAESLIAEGARVVLCSRKEPELSKLSREIGATGFVVADLSQPDQGRNACQEAIRLLDGLDILVTNTGGPAKGTFMEISTDQWQRDYQNLWLSVVECFRVALPEMKKNNYGRLLLVTSIAGKEPLPALTTSNGLRAGLEGLSKSISTEYAPFGITVNILRPGYTNTDRLKELKLSDEQVKKMVPTGRLGAPQELADLATFLASPRAGYITGQCISIDGGVQKSY